MTFQPIWNFILSSQKEVSTCQQEKTIMHLIAFLIAEAYSKRCPISTQIEPCHIVELERLSSMRKSMNWRQEPISRPEKLESLC